MFCYLIHCFSDKAIGGPGDAYNAVCEQREEEETRQQLQWALEPQDDAERNIGFVLPVHVRCLSFPNWIDPGLLPEQDLPGYYHSVNILPILLLLNNAIRLLELLTPMTPNLV